MPNAPHLVSREDRREWDTGQDFGDRNTGLIFLRLGGLIATMLRLGPLTPLKSHLLHHNLRISALKFFIFEV